MSDARSRRGRAAERGGAVAVPADRRLRVPVELPHRRARRAGRGDRLALRSPPSTRRACSAACSTGRPGSSGSGRSASTIPTARSYEPGTNVLVTTWKTPTGWIVVRDALTMGPYAGARLGHAPHAAAGRRRRRPHAGPDGRVHRGPGRGRGRLRAGVRLRPRHRPSGRWSTDDRHAADATGAGQTIRLVLRSRARHRGQPRPRPARARGGRARVLRTVLGRGARRPARRRGGRGADGRHDALLARLARRARGSPTTAGATRSSARRWRSRA